MPQTFPHLPQYCEPSHGGLLAEPLNALSSLVLVVAAIYALKVWLARERRDWPALLMVGMMVLIGINSALFHAMRTAVTLVADVVPIIGFMLTAFAIILMRLFAQSLLVSVIHLSGFLLATLMVTMMLTPRALGSGAWFVVPLVVLYVLGAILILRARLAMHDDSGLIGAAAARSNTRHFPELKMGYALVQVGVLLAVGLLARAYDLKLCSQLPFGLHLVWHVIVAMATLLLTLAIIRNTAPAVRAKAIAASQP